MKIFIGGIMPKQQALLERKLRGLPADFVFAYSSEAEGRWVRVARGCDVAFINPFCNHGHVYGIRCASVPTILIRGRSLSALYDAVTTHIERVSRG